MAKQMLKSRQVLFEIFFICAAFLSAFFVTANSAASREPLRGIALVIGNSDYKHLQPLQNPNNDAKAVSNILEGLGFDTHISTNRNARKLRRDLDNFIDDASEADVALLYYAGHGIEAGGENFLVPIDASPAAGLEGAASLVPMSSYIAKLREVVPVAVVLLDACRDNPFPSGYQLTLPGKSEPVNVSASGLSPPSASRGSFQLDVNERTKAENLVTMIGFAAEPGRAAFDGQPGTNSPYAQALTRHLAASNGERFSTVMNIVSEEVYLKTNGRQRPWVNQSIRRELYFGGIADEGDKDLAAITEERRSLLVHISSLSSKQRSTIEHIANVERVPMDITFAILRAANISSNAKPEEIEIQLRSKLKTITALKRQSGTLENPDSEVMRLTMLADEAELEGALKAANRFREMAKERVEVLQVTRDQQIEALKQRILEDAAVFEKSALTKILLNEYEAAADDYDKAIQIVKSWDTDKAFDYRIKQLRSLLDAYQILRLDEANSKFISLAKREVNQPTLNWNDTQRAHFFEFSGLASMSEYGRTNSHEVFDAAERDLLHAIELFGVGNGEKTAKAYLNLAALHYLRAWKNWSVEHYSSAIKILQSAKLEIDSDRKLNRLLRDANATDFTTDAGLSEVGAPIKDLLKDLSAKFGERTPKTLANIHKMEGLSYTFLAHWENQISNEQKAVANFKIAANIFLTQGDYRGFADVLTDLGNLHVRRAYRKIKGEAQLAFDYYERALDSLDPDAAPVTFAVAFTAMLDVVTNYPELLSSKSLSKAMRIGRKWETVSSAKGLEESIDSVEYTMGRLFLIRGMKSLEPKDFELALNWLEKFRANAETGSWLSGKAGEAIAIVKMSLALVTKDLDQLRIAVQNLDETIKTYNFLNASNDEINAKTSKALVLFHIASETRAHDDIDAALTIHTDISSSTELCCINAAEHWNRTAQLLTFKGVAENDLAALDKSAENFEKSADSFAEQLLPDNAVEARFEAAKAFHGKAQLLGDLNSFKTVLHAYQNVLNEPGQLSKYSEYFINRNMGVVLQSIAANEANLQTYKEGERRFENAIELVISNGKLKLADQWENRDQLELDVRLALTGLLHAKGEAFQNVTSFKKSAEHYFYLAENFGDVKINRATYLNAAAYSLILGHRIVQDQEAVEFAIENARTSLKLLETAENGESQYPFVMGTLCDALTEKSVLENDLQYAKRALPYCRESLEKLTEFGQTEVTAIAQKSLERVLKLLSD